MNRERKRCSVSGPRGGDWWEREAAATTHIFSKVPFLAHWSLLHSGVQRLARRSQMVVKHENTLRESEWKKLQHCTPAEIVPHWLALLILKYSGIKLCSWRCNWKARCSNKLVTAFLFFMKIRSSDMHLNIAPNLSKMNQWAAWVWWNLHFHTAHNSLCLLSTALTLDFDISSRWTPCQWPGDWTEERKCVLINLQN